MNQTKLNEVLKEHKKWLWGEGGSRAYLVNENLVGVDFESSILRGATIAHTDLSYKDFSNADLSYVDFTGSDLKFANFYGADMGNVDLSDTDLEGANTQKVRGTKILSIDNIGTFNGKVTFIPSINRVFAGCWEGDLEEFLEAGLIMNSANEKEKRNIEIAYELFRNNEEESK